jgi:hypothetical protein
MASTTSISLWHISHYSNYTIYGLLQLTTALPLFPEFTDKLSPTPFSHVKSHFVSTAFFLKPRPSLWTWPHYPKLTQYPKLLHAVALSLVRVMMWPDQTFLRMVKPLPLISKYRACVVDLPLHPPSLMGCLPLRTPFLLLWADDSFVRQLFLGKLPLELRCQSLTLSPERCLI